jgi:hypothetical protein
MAAKSEATLISDIAASVLSGGRRTTAANVRALLADVLDSYANIVDGGNVYQTEVGYTSDLAISGQYSFVHKKWVEDNFVPMGGIGSLSQTLAVGNTTGGYNILLSGADVIADSAAAYSYLDLNNARLYFTDGYNNYSLQSDLSGGTIEMSVRDIVSITLEQSYVQALVNGINIGCYSQSTGNETKIQLGTIFSTITSTYATYAGLEYAADYSANYTNRSLVDKGYVTGLNLGAFAATTSAQLAGVISDETGSGALVFGTSPTFSIGITVGGGAGSGNVFINRPSVSFSANAVFQTASTNQWAFGMTSTLASNDFAILDAVANAVRFSITRGSTGYINMGNYATPTAQRLVTIGQDTAFMSFGSYTAATSYGAIYMGAATPGTLNYTLISNGATCFINGTTAVNTRVNNSTQLSITNTTFTVTSDATASGAVTPCVFTIPANTGQTASTEISNFKVNGASKTWANGGGATTIGTQRWNYFTANTAATSGGGSLTITNSYGLYAEAAVASGVTITNNYAAGFSGNIYIDGATGSSIFNNSAGSNTLRVQRTSGTVEAIVSAQSGGVFIGSSTAHQVTIQSAGGARISFAGSGTGDCTVTDAVNFILGSTTGHKFGTATTQKLSFWNATPIVQPTTAVAAATLSSLGGTALTSTDTFDGYTLLQVVKALRNIGLLA